MSDIAAELAKLHTLKGADYSRQVERIAQWAIFILLKEKLITSLRSVSLRVAIRQFGILFLVAVPCLWAEHHHITIQKKP